MLQCFHNVVSQRQSLKEFRLFLCLMYALILYFAGNIKCQGGEGGGNEEKGKKRKRKRKRVGMPELLSKIMLKVMPKVLHKVLPK